MKTIEITTTQNVTIAYELAGLRDRFLAMIVDLLIIGVLVTVFSVSLGIAFSEEFGTDSSSQRQSVMLIRGLVPILIFLSYHFLSELLMDGQSFGKRAMGIKVVKLDGSEATAGDYLLRALFHFVDTLFSLYLLGALLILGTDKNQRMGDLAANTSLIRVKFNLRFRLEDIMKIDSRENYEADYPDVRQFSEQDMLLIKSVIARNKEYGNAAHRKVVDQLVRDLMLRLDIVQPPEDEILFLKILIRDYIVLTR